VIVNKSKGVARFAFMHCIGASICFWLYAIKNETIDSILEKKFFHEASHCGHHEDDHHAEEHFLG